MVQSDSLKIEHLCSLIQIALIGFILKFVNKVPHLCFSILLSLLSCDVYILVFDSLRDQVVAPSITGPWKNRIQGLQYLNWPFFR